MCSQLYLVSKYSLFNYMFGLCVNIIDTMFLMKVNGVFFTIAMVVMSKHFKKQINKDKAPTVRYETYNNLRSCHSLFKIV